MKNLTKRILMSVTMLFFFFWATSLQAQQVIATSGNFNQSANGAMSWTVGELAIQTYTGSQTVITQGFHQVSIKATAIQELPGLNYAITVFPNPTTEMVKLKIETNHPEKLQYLIFDVNGKLLLQKKVSNTESDISFGSYIPSSYILKVMESNQELKTFKIVKQ